MIDYMPQLFPRCSGQLSSVAIELSVIAIRIEVQKVYSGGYANLGCAQLGSHRDPRQRQRPLARTRLRPDLDLDFPAKVAQDYQHSAQQAETVAVYLLH